MAEQDWQTATDRARLVADPRGKNTERPNLAQQARELNEDLAKAHTIIDRLLGEEAPQVQAIPMAGGGVGAELQQGLTDVGRLVARLNDVVQRGGRL